MKYIIPVLMLLMSFNAFAAPFDNLWDSLNEVRTMNLVGGGEQEFTFISFFLVTVLLTFVFFSIVHKIPPFKDSNMDDKKLMGFSVILALICVFSFNVVEWVFWLTSLFSGIWLFVIAVAGIVFTWNWGQIMVSPTEALINAEIEAENLRERRGNMSDEARVRREEKIQTKITKLHEKMRIYADTLKAKQLVEEQKLAGHLSSLTNIVNMTSISPADEAKFNQECGLFFAQAKRLGSMFHAELQSIKQGIGGEKRKIGSERNFEAKNADMRIGQKFIQMEKVIENAITLVNNMENRDNDIKKLMKDKPSGYSDKIKDHLNYIQGELVRIKKEISDVADLYRTV